MVRTWIALCLLAWPALANAQWGETLDAYLREGAANNLGLKQQALQTQQKRESIKQAKALYYPNIGLDLSYLRAGGGRRLDFPVGDLLNPVYGTLNQITQSNQFPSIANERIQFLPDNFHETKATLGMPLYNSDVRHNLRIREHLAESAQAQQNAYERELRYRIVEAYLQYLSALELGKIWAESQAVLSELRRFNESLVRNGAGTPDLLASADYELSKAARESASARAAQQNAAAYFNWLLQRDPQTPIVVDTNLLQPAKRSIALDAMGNLNPSRPELVALQQGMAAAHEAQKMSADRRRLPQVYLGGEFGFQGFGYTFAGEQAYALGKIGLTYPIYQAGALKSKEQEAHLEALRLQNQYEEMRQAFQMQTIKAMNDLEAAFAEEEAAQSGLLAAQMAFRIVNNRYRNGQALLLEYLEAQNRVVAASIIIVLAQLKIAQTEAALIFASGF